MKLEETYFCETSKHVLQGQLCVVHVQPGPGSEAWVPAAGHK